MRRVSLIAGLLLLAALWLGPLPELARRAFFAHMSMHMGVVAVAAPLIAAGLAGGRYDPVRRRPAVFHPILASAVELVVVWAWHAPGLHHFARAGAGGLVVEQGTFLAAGLLVWLSALGGSGEGDAARSRAAGGVVGLLLTAMHMTLLGALLGLASRPLYHGSESGHVRGDAHGAEISGFSLTPLEDQHLGGAIMLLVGGLVYLIGGLWLTTGLLRRSAVEAEGSS